MINRGSEWHRWEPHIHTPGTILNDQFGTTDPWEQYLATLEGLTPTIEAIMERRRVFGPGASYRTLRLISSPPLASRWRLR